MGNLCTHETLRVTMMQSGALEPLCSLARSEDIELEIQRYAVLAIANLAISVDNHVAFIEEGMLTLLISLSNAPDPEVRTGMFASGDMLARMVDNGLGMVVTVLRSARKTPPPVCGVSPHLPDFNTPVESHIAQVSMITWSSWRSFPRLVYARG